MNLKLPFEINHKNGFIILAIIMGILMPVLSFDSGITEDSRIHNEHGQRILDYFKGIDDTAGLSPLNEKGKFINVSLSKYNVKRGMNGFGGFFDLLSSFVHQYFSFVGIYELRNVLSSLFGFLLFLFCGLIGKEIAGWRAGVFSFVLVILTPLLFGQAMFNPKDIPFAAFYIFCIFHLIKLLKELPEVTLKRSFFLIVNISFLINIRLLGLVMIGHIFLAVFVWWFVQNYKDRFQKVIFKDTLILIAKVSAVCIIGYLATAIFWPYLHSNPIFGLIELFIAVADFKGFHSTQLFEGIWRTSFRMPWYYMIKSLLFIQMPLFVFAGMLLAPLLYLKERKETILLSSVLFFTSFFPVLLIILGESNSYDNGRQFIFVIPPLIVACGLAWNRLFVFITIKKIRIAAYVFFLILIFQPLRFTIANHPLQSGYFSPIIGGLEGAYGNYEIDYWGYAVKPAIDWLKDNAGEEFNASNPARVRNYYGEQSKVRYFLNKTPNLTHVMANRNSPHWDYSIVMLTEAKYKKDMNINWSPTTTVHEIKIDDVPICFIIKNNFNEYSYITNLEKELINKPTIDGYIRLSLAYFGKKKYLKSIEASKKALALNPKNSRVYNNLCSSYNMLMMYDKAIEACENSIKYTPSNLAFNNLKIAKNRSSQIVEKGRTLKEYIALSFNYYRLKHYKDCIVTSKKIVEIDKENYIAYNNMCASYNNLQQWDKAIEACNKALEIQTDFQLAKNNLRLAEKRFNEQ